MGLSRVTRNYQITIPLDVRQSQDIDIGDTVLFTVDDHKVELQKFKQNILEEAFGSWGRGKNGIVSVRRIRREWNKREQRQKHHEHSP